VRVIAATNRDLSQMVKDGTFREDLYYRIKVLSVKMPPLRNRRRDIPLLCEHFILMFNSRFSKRISGVSSVAMDILLAYDYPGNIRELENIIEHAFIFCKTGNIEPEHLPPEPAGSVPARIISGSLPENVRSFEDLERLFIKKILAENNDNKPLAAAKMGIHKVTLYRKMKTLGMETD
jgi:transcriptional regulator with PAS, ATPase and Fis domain